MSPLRLQPRNASDRKVGTKKPVKATRSRATERGLRYSKLTVRERATRERALNLLSDLRRGEGSYAQLLRKHQLNTRQAHKHLGRNLLGGTRGHRVRASKSDRFVRELLFPTYLGDVPTRIHGSRAATTLSEYFHDRDKLLHGKLGGGDFEAKWRGVHVDGREVFADVAGIFRMANADVLKVEDLYASTGGAR